MADLDLSGYVERGEIPTDPAVLEQLMNSWGKDSTEQAESATPADTGKTESAATGAVESVVEGKKSEAEGEKEPDGILSKDGKHVIPYDALKSERQARQEYQNQVEELTRQLEAAKSGQFTQAEMSAFEGMTPEQIDELKEYFPEQHAALLKQQEAIRATNQKLREFEQKEEERKIAEAKQVQQTVQETIDNNPVLSHWQRNNPEAWAKCLAQDNIERADPVNSKLTMSERFEKVVQKVLLDFEHPFPEKKQGDAKKQAETKTVPQEQKKPPINSLSEVKGGEAAEATLLERFSSLSPAEINAAMAGMSARQQDEFLMKLSMNQ